MISYQLFDAVARQIVQTSILIVAVGALMPIVSRRRPHLAYLFLLLVLVKSLIPPVLSSPTGIFSWSAATSVAASAPIQSHPDIVVPVQPAAISSSAPVAILQSSSSWSITGIAMVIWAIGALSMLLAVLIRSSNLKRRISASAMPVPADLLATIESLRHSLGIRRNISLTLSNQPIGPAVFGILRPALVVPHIILDDQNHHRLRALLAHELLHLRRGDTLVAGLQLLAQIVWWFNPLVWLLNSQINQVREMCCDAEAIANTQCPRDDYAQMLVDVLRRRRVLQPMSNSPGVRPAQVTARRLHQVLRGTGWSHRHLPWQYWIALAFCSLLILPGSKIQFHSGAGSAFADPPPTGSSPEPADAGHQRITHYVRVVVDVDSLTFQGKPATLNDLPTLLEAVPDRANTVLEVAYASDQVTMGWYDKVLGQFKVDKEFQKLGFKYLSNIGLQPAGSVGSPDRLVETPWQGYPRLAPYDAIRWQGQTPKVRVDGHWYELLAIDAVPVDQIVTFSRSRGAGMWQKHFNEDLVELLTKMGHNPGTSVTLRVRDLASGNVQDLKEVPMTEKNRQAIWAVGIQESLSDLVPHAPVSELQHVVPFEEGKISFTGGDRITITEVRGTADTFKVGDTYMVKGAYHLASRDSAQLALFVTAIHREDSWSPVSPDQILDIHRGDGSFTLIERMACEGYPHVSFYAGGNSIGGIYFGTGASLLNH